MKRKRDSITWNDLNSDVIRYIALWLPYVDLLVYLRICKKTANIIRLNDNGKFWREKAQHEFSIKTTAFDIIHASNNQLKYLDLYEERLCQNLRMLNHKYSQAYNERVSLVIISGHEHCLGIAPCNGCKKISHDLYNETTQSKRAIEMAQLQYDHIERRRKDRFISFGAPLPVYHHDYDNGMEYKIIRMNQLVSIENDCIYQYTTAKGQVVTIGLGKNRVIYARDIIHCAKNYSNRIKLTDLIDLVRELVPEFRFPETIRAGDILFLAYYVYEIDNIPWCVRIISNIRRIGLPLEMLSLLRKYHIRTRADLCNVYGLWHQHCGSMQKLSFNVYTEDARMLRLAFDENEYAAHISDPAYYHDIH